MILLIVFALTLVVVPKGQGGHCGKSPSFAALNVCATPTAYLSNVPADIPVINKSDFGVISPGVSKLRLSQQFASHEPVFSDEISHPPNSIATS
ncbi:hypothetical protein [Candidatus Magnetominusculus dajiuhuensis]|uniref:hypothetical protein n=1 Tax=Candidatus Magnetominusculus dajiuhuensis TaxID=3137712 RepID=UPI003B4350CA